MSDTHSRLKGVAIALNAHLTAVRRHVDERDEPWLRRELATAAALLEEARGLLSVEELAAARTEPAVECREAIELDAAAGYALWSETYHEQADNPLTALEEPVLAPLLAEVAGRRVLDVGCGTGRHALRLAARGALVTGLDPSPQMLAVARAEAQRQGLDADLRPGRFGELPADGSFDLVLCSLVLCHLPEIGGPVAEMARCLKPGGRLIITDFHYLCLAIGWRTRFRHDGHAYHIENYRHTYGEYLRVLQACGLSLLALEDILIDDTLRGKGMDSVVDKWEGFPFGMLVAATKPA